MSQLAIDPATVQASLRKTSLHVDLGFGASVRQFEEDPTRVDRRGLFYVIVYHKKNPKDANWTSRSPLLGFDGNGAYTAASAARQDILSHRMSLEGSVQKDGDESWYGSLPMMRSRLKSEKSRRESVLRGKHPIT